MNGEPRARHATCRPLSFVSLLPGNILPLALIMMMIILMGGIGIGLIVAEGSKRAAESNDSVAAYYLADSGVESQLFQIRKNNQTLAYVNSMGLDYGDGRKWVSTGALEQPLSKTIKSVTTSSFAVLDLFDPDNMTAPLNVSQMHLTWATDPTCTAGDSYMEVSYAYWDVVGGVPQFPTDQQFIVHPKDATHSLRITLDANKRYRIRLKAYTCPAINVTAIFLNPSGFQVPYPGDITLSAEGTYKAATQKIAVTMPKLDVLSGVFSYVLFSECTLVKGTDAVVCPP